LLTEDSAGRAFTERYGAILRYDHTIGKWFVWTGQLWQCERTKLAFAWARELVRSLAEKAPTKVRYVANKTSFATGVEKFSQSDRACAVTADLWDQNPYLLGTPSGTIDLRTGKLKAADPADYITAVTSIAPTDTIDCPRWLRFLDEAAKKDADLIAFLRQFCGYALTGDTREHALLFIYGPGGNGKTVFLNTVVGILGDYCRTAPMDTFTASPSDRHPTDLARLKGARMVSAAETEEGRAWAETRIKELTGGDKIAARFMRQDFFEFTPQFKLVLIGNHKPTLRNVDEATRRRFNIVPFIERPAKPDKQLERKLRAEWPGILRWMIAGCIEWQQHGLIRPSVVTEATEEYFSEQDVIRQWTEECCDTGRRSLSDTTANLFKSWSAYALEAGEKPGTKKWFTQSLVRLGFERTRNPTGHRNKRGFIEIAVTPIAAPDWTDPDGRK
jgi:putative DNA primase/helicase